MGVFLLILFLLLAIAVLVKASDIFIDLGEELGRALGIPSFLIGVTILATGTSLPELVSSLIAVLTEKDATEIVSGNVVGSNITNICLILGVIAIIKPNLKLDNALFKFDFPFLIASAVIISIMMWHQEMFTATDGVICLVLFAIYIIIAIRNSRKLNLSFSESDSRKSKVEWKTLVRIAIAGAFIYIGAKYTVMAIIMLSEALEIGKELITLTVVALGTSLPEFVVAVVSIKKGKSEMAIGNLLGSNIFNSFAIMGLPALFSVLAIPDSILKFSIPVMIGSTIIFLIVALQKKFTLVFGIILIIIYVAYLSGLVAFDTVFQRG